MAKTIVIAFEGIDGSGKTVQMQRLARRLSDRGMRVATRAFPAYDSFFGKEIGYLLSGAEGVTADQVDHKSMALWFALDRFEAMRDYVDGEADVLLINRYVLSNAVYQSIRDRDLAYPDLLDWVFDLEFGRFGLPVPDVHVVLDVGTEIAGGNVDKKGYRDYVGGNARDVYESIPGIQQRARLKYLEYAERRSDILVIPCMENGKLMSELEIADLIEEALLKRGII
ncbi:MAG: dTMP kinase [Clostridia bacterium]|nr:dTMP kinase [Clostridia bacterium]